MHVPLTPYGLREILAGCVAAALGIAGGWALAAQTGWTSLGVIASVFFGLAFFYVLFFFRDFERTPPAEPGFLAPADGTVTDVTTVTENEFIGGPALKIGIFMSLVSCHVNRNPSDGTVAWVEHRPGKCINALNPQSAVVNDSWWIGIDTSHGKALVRQITGVIARRIVCGLKVGDTVQRGARFGMIKFGSRSELYINTDAGFESAVQPGDKVYGGLTILARLGVAEPVAAAVQEAQA